MQIVKSVNRLGIETAFKVLDEAKKLEKKGKKIIHLSLEVNMSMHFTSLHHIAIENGR